MRKFTVLILMILSTNVWAQQPPPEGVSSANWSQDSFVKNSDRAAKDASNFVNSILGDEESKTVEVDAGRDGNAAAAVSK